MLTGHRTTGDRCNPPQALLERARAVAGDRGAYPQSQSGTTQEPSGETFRIECLYADTAEQLEILLIAHGAYPSRDYHEVPPRLRESCAAFVVMPRMLEQLPEDLIATLHQRIDITICNCS